MAAAHGRGPRLKLAPVQGSRPFHNFPRVRVCDSPRQLLRVPPQPTLRDPDCPGSASICRNLLRLGPRRLLRASRKLRLAAVPLIPRLIDAIKAMAEKSIAAVEQAKRIADSLK